MQADGQRISDAERRGAVQCLWDVFGGTQTAKGFKVLHERVVILAVAIQDVPVVDESERCSVKDLGQGFYRMSLRYGFLEETDVPAALKRADICGGPFEMMKTSFFLSRQTLIASAKPGMAIWREKLFAWMLRNAASAMEFFRLPTNRVVELGSQVEI